MTDWLDRAPERDGPIYLGLLRALQEAIRSGELQPGDRLPPQREVARRLGVDLTTVTRAYAAARARGLVEGVTGRGTFVQSRTEDEAGLVDLSMNLPPPPEGLSLAALLRATTNSLLERADPTVLMAYHPGFGTVGQRAAAARWLQPCLDRVPLERLLVSPGAQAGLAAVFASICSPGAAVATDPLTYPGFLALARSQGLRVVACPVDEEGPVPEALEQLCDVEAPAALYLTPTMQNPSARTMSLARRQALAGVAARRGVWIVEDDPYSRLMEAPPPAIAALAPEHAFHVATLSKCLSPGLRIAYVACPPGWTERVAERLRAIALMPAPLMAAVATRWIQESEAEALLAAVRAEARARRAIAASTLPQAAGGPESLHVWLPLAGVRAAERLRSAAQMRGVALVTAEAFAVDETHPAGARISLGGPSRRQVLEAALRALADAAGEDKGPPPLVV